MDQLFPLKMTIMIWVLVRIDLDKDGLDNFLNLAQQDLVSQIVDLNSREDFDTYMKSLESKYY